MSGALFLVGVGGWGISLGGWGVVHYFRWVGAGGGEWEWVAVGALFDNACLLFIVFVIL